MHAYHPPRFLGTCRWKPALLGLTGVLAWVLAVVPIPAFGASDAALSDSQAAQAAQQAAEAAEAAARAAQAVAEAVHQLIQATLHPHPPSGAFQPGVSPWSFELGFSAMAVRGNAEALSGQVTVGVEGQWRKWATEVHMGAAYGETTANGPKEVSALNAELNVRGVRNYNPTLGSYVYTGLLTDHVASISSHVFGEMGITLTWWEDRREDRQDGYLKSRLRTSLGLRATRETRYPYFSKGATPAFEPPKIFYGPPLNINFRYGLTRNAFFTQEVEILQDIRDGKNLRMHTTTALTAQIHDGLALQVTLRVQHIGAPAADKKPTDAELASGITWTW